MCLALDIRFTRRPKNGRGAAEIARATSEVAPDNPFRFVHMAYALHELKRTRDAWNVLLPVVDKFPDEYIIFADGPRINRTTSATPVGTRVSTIKLGEDSLNLLRSCPHT
jgi:hypothetical protein